MSEPRLWEEMEVPQEEIRFSFEVGHYGGPLMHDRYRQEVEDFGLYEEVHELLRGRTPEGFEWMQPVIEDQIANEGKPNRAMRFLAVVEELKRSQEMTDRDTEYERRVEALGRLLYDSCDENFNYLGFFLKIRTLDGEVHEHQWGSLLISENDGQWWVGNEYPITEIDEIVPYRVPDPEPA